MTNLQYLYATRGSDYEQHLLDAPTGPALCGETAVHWRLGEIGTRVKPGVPLCKQCELERKARKADAKAAELRAQKAAVKTFWLQERTP
jgi:hypothetical protein